MPSLFGRRNLTSVARIFSVFWAFLGLIHFCSAFHARASNQFVRRWQVTGCISSSSSTTGQRRLQMSNQEEDDDDDDEGKDGRRIVIIGGGIQGTSVAFQLHESSAHVSITILESQSLASAASGKGGGFMARSWGDGTPTQRLHELAFDMYEELAERLGVESYRKLPVLSVAPADKPAARTKKHPLADVIPNWLDGSVGRIAALGYGEDTAQVTPKDFVDRMMAYVASSPENSSPDSSPDTSPDSSSGIQVVLGTCQGIDTSEDDQHDGIKRVTGVRYIDQNQNEFTLPADDVIVAAGPWSCQAEQWFQGAVQLPMEGVKSTSIVWKPPLDLHGNPDPHAVDATALFCGEDHRFGTHLEVYPRPDGTIYICGIGGSDYISTSELQSSAFLSSCPPKPTRVEAATSAFRLLSNTYATQGELSHAQACMRPCPPDALPYMGKIPGYRGAYINAGHNCWGIAWAPACGKAMAELVLEGESHCVDLTPFDPARFTPKNKRGGRGRKKGSMSVGEQW